MANYDRYDRNDSGRRSDNNRYDRFTSERNSVDRNNDRNRMTGDWNNDERRSHSEQDQDRGFFERAADTVSSWFGGEDDNRRESDRHEQDLERRYSTEGRGTRRGDWNSTFDTRHGANMDRDRYSDRQETRDELRSDYNYLASRDDLTDNRRQNTQGYGQNTQGYSGNRGYTGSQRSSYPDRSFHSERSSYSDRSSYPERFNQDQPDGREAGRDYYNRLNDDLRTGGSNYSSHNTPYASNQFTSGRSSNSGYGSYGRTGNYGSQGSDYSRSDYDNSRSGSSSSYGSASRGQYAGKGPKGYQRGDDRIKEDVCEYLTRNAMIDASDIEITVTSGVVTLTGTVPDRQMKRMSEDEIEMLPGVKDVNNQLRVNRENSGSTMDSNTSTSARSGSSLNNNSSNGNGLSGTSSSSRTETNGSNLTGSTTKKTNGAS